MCQNFMLFQVTGSYVNNKTMQIRVLFPQSRTVCFSTPFFFHELNTLLMFASSIAPSKTGLIRTSCLMLHFVQNILNKLR